MSTYESTVCTLPKKTCWRQQKRRESFANKKRRGKGGGWASEESVNNLSFPPTYIHVRVNLDVAYPWGPHFKENLLCVSSEIIFHYPMTSLIMF